MENVPAAAPGFPKIPDHLQVRVDMPSVHVVRIELPPTQALDQVLGGALTIAVVLVAGLIVAALCLRVGRN